MNTSLLAHRRAPVVIAVLCAALAIGIGFRLASYEVALSLLIACATSCFSTFYFLLIRMWEAAGTTTHRCTIEGCAFQVRLTHTDEAEARRWEQAAEAHPVHRP